MNLALLLLFIVIQVADVLTTYLGLQLGNSEAAPVGATLFARLGFWPTIGLIKGGGVALAVGAYVLTSNSSWFIGPLDLIGGFVLANNLKVIIA